MWIVRLHRLRTDVGKPTARGGKAEGGGVVNTRRHRWTRRVSRARWVSGQFIRVKGWLYTEGPRWEWIGEATTEIET